MADPYRLSALRFALRHLYDSSVLHTSPLLKAVAATGATNPAASLRLTLTRAIEVLRPGPDAPPQSPARRAYEILYYRYVQQCTTQEVADQVGLSVRHLKREHHKALDRLAQCLSDQFGLPIDLDDGHPDGAPTIEGEGMLATPARSARWSEAALPGRRAELCAVVPAVLDLVQPLLARYHARPQLADLEGLPPVAVDPVVLRQMLLSLLCVAIRQSAEGALSIVAGPQGGQLKVDISADCPRASGAAESEDIANMEVAHRLAESCGASLSIQADSGPFVATVGLPALQEVPVLVVDDHVDALQLLQRYASGTRYRVFCATSAEEAVAVAAKVSPHIIILDVMMPQVDGWELLGRLRQHPLTCNTPVVACTVVAEEELAIALGVRAFLRKPVSRADFLAALDRLAPPGGDP